MIIYPTFPNTIVWSLGRVLIGFCFSAVYVTAESWLNNAATNENRGQALSAYMIVQTLGIVIAQALLLTADPSGFVLFVIPSVLVSIAVTPILLSISPTPPFDTTKPMSLRELMDFSPLGCVGMFLLGGVFSAQFGMAAVYGAEAGLSVGQISLFVAMFFVGSVILQYPIGWISDRMDRRSLIVIVATLGGIGSVIGMTLGHVFPILLATAFLVGGMSNPLYSLLMAHTNDFLEHEDMASASGGMMFINGLGAVLGPVITGWMMGTALGPGAFTSSPPCFSPLWPPMPPIVRHSVPRCRSTRQATTCRSTLRPLPWPWRSRRNISLKRNRRPPRRLPKKTPKQRKTPLIAITMSRMT
jgi:MFS family permease